MKNRLLAVLSVTALAGALFVSPRVEAKGYGMAGCGLGSLVIKSNDISQIFAATLNATGIQTFGITSGTSNCSSDGIVLKEKAQELFVTVNYESLEQEMALGKGEKLNTFAQLLGCTSDISSAQFGKMAKDKYSSLIHSDTTPALLLSAVKSEVRKNESLSKSCALL
ncbi:PF11220 family protein [Leptospira inadai serovar Lyme str. 10]|uniref:PF11220 family protein n=2 Tax=Leptospira inadai serovar Lyme TaxID=293084 RepID=V6HLU7_9LEPT|nr:DUF3015 domain-containing protein [Leptospira inadai]EQA37840.1 PF11220 family protein [Leptospira inadai serovar Lyme str. 10]PNV71903.1 DUF3015 domain-containing protein [Leptospira inadai serovar Lyme]